MMINKSYQCDWSSLKRGCCLYIINNPMLSTEEYQERMGVGKHMVYDCFESLNMPLSKRPDHCVGGISGPTSSRYADFIKNMRAFASSYSCKFERQGSKWLFITKEGRRSDSFMIKDWKSLYDKNLVLEIIGIQQTY